MFFAQWWVLDLTSEPLQMSVPQSVSRQCGFEGSSCVRVPRIPRGTFSSFMCCRTTIVLQAICAEVTEFLVFTRRVLTVSDPGRQEHCGLMRTRRANHVDLALSKWCLHCSRQHYWPRCIQVGP